MQESYFRYLPADAVKEVLLQGSLQDAQRLVKAYNITLTCEDLHNIAVHFKIPNAVSLSILITFSTWSLDQQIKYCIDVNDIESFSRITEEVRTSDSYLLLKKIHRPEIASILLRRALNWGFKFDSTNLALAASTGDYDLVKEILNTGVDNIDYDQVIRSAVKGDNIEIVELLAGNNVDKWLKLLSPTIDKKFLELAMEHLKYQLKPQEILDSLINAKDYSALAVVADKLNLEPAEEEWEDIFDSAISRKDIAMIKRALQHGVKGNKVQQSSLLSLREPEILKLILEASLWSVALRYASGYQKSDVLNTLIQRFDLDGVIHLISQEENKMYSPWLAYMLLKEKYLTPKELARIAYKKQNPYVAKIAMNSGDVDKDVKDWIRSEYSLLG